MNNRNYPDKMSVNSNLQDKWGFNRLTEKTAKGVLSYDCR